MPPNLQLMVEDAIEELRNAGLEGILISDLFENVHLVLSSDDLSKDAVWEALLERDDILIYHHDSALNKSPFLKLGYKDALDLGQGDRKLLFKPRNQAMTHDHLPTGRDENLEMAETSKPEGVLVPVEAKRRRGRPPKIKKADQPQAPGKQPESRRGRSSRTIADPTIGISSQPVAAPVDSSLPKEQLEINPNISSSSEVIVTALPKRVSKPKIRYEPPFVEKATSKAKKGQKSASSHIISPSNEGNHVINATRKMSSRSRANASPLPSDENVKHSHVEIDSSSAKDDQTVPLGNLQTASPEAASIPTVQDEEPQSSIVVLETSPKSSNAISPKPLPVLLSDMEPLRDNALPAVTNAVVQSIVPKAAHPFLPTLASTTNTVRQSSRVTNSRKLHDSTREVSSRETSSIPDASLESSKNILDEDRRPGVFIDPPGSQRQFPRTRGRPPKSTIAVFRSQKLMNSEWLEQQKGTWIQSIVTAVARNLIVAEDSPREKRKYVRRTQVAPGQTEIELNSETPAGGEINKPAAENKSITAVVALSAAIQTTSATNFPAQTHTGEGIETHGMLGEQENQGVKTSRDEVRASGDNNRIPDIQNERALEEVSSIPNQKGTIDTRTINTQHQDSLDVSKTSSEVPKVVAVGKGPHLVTAEEPSAKRKRVQSPTSGISNSNQLFNNLGGLGRSGNPSILSQLKNGAASPLSPSQPSEGITSHSNTFYRSPYGNQFGSRLNEAQSSHQQGLFEEVPTDATHMVSLLSVTQQSRVTAPVAPSTQLNAQNQSASDSTFDIFELFENPQRKETESLINSYRSPFKPASGGTTHNSLIQNSLQLPQPARSEPSIQRPGHEPPRGYFTSDAPNQAPLSTALSNATLISHSRAQQAGGSKRKLSQVGVSGINGAELAFEDNTQKNQKKSLVSKRNTPSKGSAIDQDYQFQTALDRASAIPVHDGVTRLPCMHQNKVGNLLLSQDMTTLEFISLMQYPPQMPLLTLAVSEILRNPITSVPGSKPMELRIKSVSQGPSEKLHCFAFSNSSPGIEAATNMRAKIVTALMLAVLQPGATEPEGQKPYKCGKCEGRFKNKNGLEYHLTKSNSACNPNANPSTRSPRQKFRGRPRRLQVQGRKKQSVADDVSTNTTRGASVKLTGDLDTDQSRVENGKQISSVNLESEDDSSSSTSSEDSVIEWFKKHATNGPTRRGSSHDLQTPSKPTPKRLKIYKSLPREAFVVQGIIKDLEAAFIDPSPDDPQIQSHIEVANEIANDVFPSGILDGNAYESLLMAIISKNHNMFPGDKSLWMACIGIWLKKNQDHGTGANHHNAPLFKLCCKALDNLVVANELDRHEFTFEDKSLTRQMTRHFYTIPGITMDHHRVKMLKELISASYPEFYIPSQFAPPQTVLDKLQEAASPAITRTRVMTVSDVESEDDELVVIEDSDGLHSTEDIFDEIEQESAVTESEESEESLDEDQSQPTTPRRRGRSNASMQPRSNGSSRPSRDSAHNGAISDGLRRYWDAVRQRGGGIHPYSGERLRRPMRIKPKVPLSQQERDKRSLKAQLSNSSWSSQFSHTNSFMPNPETGAWDQKLAVINLGKTRRGKKLGRKVNRRPRLPEPVTFLQAENGAWSVRPFGHGVNPIYSRPARRAYGNPALDSYLARVQNGFRPIIYPTKNRLFLPAAPSKQFLESIREGKMTISENTADNVRISQRTGLPVRKWVKKEPLLPRKRKRSHHDNEEEDEEDEDFQLSEDSQPPKRPRRHYTRRQRSINGLISAHDDTNLDQRNLPSPATAPNEVDIIDIFEPKRLEAGATRNPGLETVPRTFGLSNSPSKGSPVNYHSFFHSYAQVKFEELKIVEEPHVVQEISYFEEGSWTVSLLTPFKSEDCKVQWDDQTALTTETLPYNLLLSDDDDDSPEHLADIRPTTRPKKRHRGPHRKEFSKASENAQKVTYTRSHTHLTSDFDGIYRNAEDIAKVFNVQVTAPNQAIKRRQRNLTHMSPQDETRFVVTVIVIRTLTGGLDLLVDWVLIATIFKKFAMSYLQKRWGQISLRLKPTIDRLTTDFQEPFLTAYERGDIDPIDYDNLVNYDWNKLVDWVMRNVDTHLGNRPIDIPGSRKELGNLYHYNEIQREANNRDILFLPGAAVYRRIEVASAEPNSIPIHQTYSRPEMDELEIAKSWVRVVALTPEEDWNLEIGKAKLNDLGLPLVTKALQNLTEGKVIMHRAKGRVTPGRSYEATDAFSIAFRKIIRVPQFVEAVTFKRFLDSEFRRGIVGIRVDYMANEGTILAITSLQAHHRIRLVPTGLPMDKFGLTDGGYETRTIPKQRLRFDMDIFPTESYVYDDENDILRKGMEFGPPRGNLEAIPIWFSITEKVNSGIWKRVVTAVGQTLALRAGLDARELTRLMKPSMEEWEVRLVLDWGTDLGLWKRLDETMGGWLAAEWWWLLVGTWCVNGDSNLGVAGEEY